MLFPLEPITRIRNYMFKKPNGFILKKCSQALGFKEFYPESLIISLIIRYMPTHKNTSKPTTEPVLSLQPAFGAAHFPNQYPTPMSSKS